MRIVTSGQTSGHVPVSNWDLERGRWGGGGCTKDSVSGSAVFSGRKVLLGDYAAVQDEITMFQVAGKSGGVDDPVSGSAAFGWT